MPGRRRRRAPEPVDRELQENLVVELMEKIDELVPVRDLALLEQGRAITWDTLDEWQRKNGTPRVEISTETWDMVQRYRQIVAYSMDIIAPMLPLAAATLAERAIGGDMNALKLFLSYFIQPLAQRTDININQQSMSVEVKEERLRVWAERWNQDMAQGIVSDPIVDSVVVKELEAPID